MTVEQLAKIDSREVYYDTGAICTCDGDKACLDCIQDGLYAGPDASNCESCNTDDANEYNGGYDDDEPCGPADYSDDGDALASAGFGTDEDYGYFGDD